jgi:hypothetical protein
VAGSSVARRMTGDGVAGLENLVLAHRQSNHNKQLRGQSVSLLHHTDTRLDHVAPYPQEIIVLLFIIFPHAPQTRFCS